MSHKSVIQALLAVSQDVGTIPKSSSQALNYQFRGIDAMMDRIAPAFRAHGVVVIPEVTSVHTDEILVGRNQTRMGYARVVVDYHFHAVIDATQEAVQRFSSKITVTTVGEAMDSSDKAINKALTQAYKNALWQTLCIPTGDPDPDATRTERNDDSAPEWTSAERDRMVSLQSRLEALPTDLYAKAIERIAKRAGRTVTKLEALGPLWIPYLDDLLSKAEAAASGEGGAPQQADGDDDDGADHRDKEPDQHPAET